MIYIYYSYSIYLLYWMVHHTILNTIFSFQSCIALNMLLVIYFICYHFHIYCLYIVIDNNILYQQYFCSIGTLIERCINYESKWAWVNAEVIVIIMLHVYVHCIIRVSKLIFESTKVIKFLSPSSHLKMLSIYQVSWTTASYRGAWPSIACSCPIPYKNFMYFIILHEYDTFII